jgi:hypothetical protein
MALIIHMIDFSRYEPYPLLMPEESEDEILARAVKTFTTKGHQLDQEFRDKASETNPYPSLLDDGDDDDDDDGEKEEDGDCKDGDGNGSDDLNPW